MIKDKQTIGRNAIFLSLEPVIFGVVGVVVSGYVARGIGAIEFGKLAFALAFINFFTLFTNFGFHNYLMNDFAAHPDVAEHEFAPIVIIRSFLGLITYLLGIFFVNILHYPRETKIVYYAAGLVVFPIFLDDSCYGVFKGKEKMQFVALNNLLKASLLEFFRFLVVFLGFKTAYALAWTRVSVESFVTIVAFDHVYRYFINFHFSFEWNRYKKIILGTLPFAFSTSFLIVYQRLDMIMLSYFTGDASVAYYKTAHLFIEKLSIISVSLVGAVYPAMSRLFVKNREKAIILYNRTLVYLFMISLPMSIGGIMLSRKIILLIYGEQYLASVPVLIILFANIPLLYVTSIMGNILMATNRAKIFAYTMTICCFINIMGNLILIPFYAHVGAAIATLITQGINIIVLTIITSRYFGMFTIDLKFAKIIISSVIMAAVLRISSEYNVFLLILIGATTYFLSIFSLKTLQKQELLELANMIKNRRRQ